MHIYITLHSHEAKYTFFSNAHGTFSNIDYLIGHKTSLNKFKKTEIISSIFFGPQGPETRNHPQGKSSKHSNSWRLKSMILNNECVKNEIKEEIKKVLKKSENEHTTVQNLWGTAKAVLRGKFIAMQPT